MRGFKALLLATALVLPLAVIPQAATAQISIGVNLGGPPPVCAYGYYGFAPYGCAPVGYYGSGYFYNGIFLGVGPWSNYGYGHGWGEHRFVNSGGGRYGAGSRGYVAVRNDRTVVNNRTVVRNNTVVRNAPAQRTEVNRNVSRAPAQRAQAPMARNGGGAPRGGGGAAPHASGGAPRGGGGGGGAHGGERH